MNLPPRYSRCTLDNFDASENALALETARAFIAGRLTGLLLVGGTGIGKTHLMAAIGQAMEREAGYEIVEIPGHRPQATEVKAVRPFYESIYDLACVMRRPFEERCGADPERDCRAADVLLLDDLGAERLVDNAQIIVEGVIESRYAHQKPTVITSNLDLDAIVERYGNRMLSRLTEGGRIVQMKGRDRRPEMGR